jgi:hypothetical protein
MRSTTYALDSTWRPLLKDMGLSIANILRRAGLPDDLLNRPAVRLHADDFHLFWKSIEEESNGNRPQKPKVREVEFFPMEEVLNEEIKIHGQPDH